MTVVSGPMRVAPPLCECPTATVQVVHLDRALGKYLFPGDRPFRDQVSFDNSCNTASLISALDSSETFSVASTAA